MMILAAVILFLLGLHLFNEGGRGLPNPLMVPVPVEQKPRHSRRQQVKKHASP